MRSGVRIRQIDLGNGLKLDARINRPTLATRLKNQDPVLGGARGSNDGNNNFNKNALTANRLGAFFDGKLSKGRERPGGVGEHLLR